jgi:hypothetical protein
MIVYYSLRVVPPEKRLLKARQAEWREEAQMLSTLQELQRKSRERLLKSRQKHAEALQKLWEKRW